MVTATATTPFSSIAPAIVYPNGTTVYKIFSAEPLSDKLLDSMLQNPVVLASRDWDKAYPVFAAAEQFAPFVLAPGLVYSSAWENAASAMEMSAVAAANSALLVSQHLASQKLPIQNES